MSFEYSGNSGDLMKSVRGLLKFNNGFFKSSKQCKFFTTQYEHRTVDAFAVSNFGLVDADIGKNGLLLEGFARWADYGTRSVVPVMWFFVFDSYGIVREYKVGVYGNLRDGCGPEPKKTRMVWERDASLELPQFEVEEKKKVEASPFANSKHIGFSGKRSTFEGVVATVREFQGNAFHYYDTGMRIQTIINVDGNQVVYWNALKDAKVGDKVKFDALVKEYSVYNGINQTIVSRATKIVVMKEETV